MEHGWAYALTDAGSGRHALSCHVDVATLPSQAAVGGARAGHVDLAIAHETQPTAAAADLTMAWVVDLDVHSCGGCVETILRRYEEAVLEVRAEI